MAKNTGPVCRMCRREGIKLMLKGLRCESAKCPMERQNRNRPPGMHAWRRGRGSDYGVRLREKQKVKRYYGVLEKQFRSYFKQAERMTGNTGEELLQLLERRLDNVVFKMNFAASRRQARQIIALGHIRLNGKRMDIPSYIVKQGDKISFRSKEKTGKMIRNHLEAVPGAVIQEWLQVDLTKLEGVVAALPSREDIQIPVEEQLIVEFCSK